MTHNEITKQAAQSVISKIDSMGEIALFKVGHMSWQATRTRSQTFKEKLASRPETFLGVYDVNARLEDIMDDLYLIGVK